MNRAEMNNLRLDQKKSNGRADVFVHGELDLASADHFSAFVERACADADLVVVDLSDCSYLDSTGLKAILHACGNARERSKIAYVGAVSQQVRRVLEVSGAVEMLRFMELSSCPSCGATFAVGLHPCPHCGAGGGGSTEV